MLRWLSVCILLLFSVSRVAALSRAALLTSLLNASYDDSLRPLLGVRPVSVSVWYRISLLYAVSSPDEQFSLDLYITERWTDPRLTFTAAQYSAPYATDIRISDTTNANGVSVWRPDTFFFNSVKCVTTDAVTKLDASGSGVVTYTRHQDCTFYTPFNLAAFPFDSQTFPLQRASFAYTTNDVVLNFPSTGVSCFSPTPNVDYVNSLWDLTSFDCSSGISAAAYIQFGGGNNTALSSFPSAVLHVSRKWQNYVLKMILPLYFLVLLSALSYFIDPMAAPARVGLSVSIVLSVTTFNLLVSQDLPKINYATLLDWYVWLCFLLVIMAVAEFAVVNHLLVSKSFAPAIPRLVDDYFQWTVPVVWSITNVVYWPIIQNDTLRGFVAVVGLAFALLNLYRVYWCYTRGVFGMSSALTALWRTTKSAVDRAEVQARKRYEQARRLAGLKARTRGAIARRNTTRRGRGRGRGRGCGRSRDRHVDGVSLSVSASPMTVIITPPSATEMAAFDHLTNDDAFADVDGDERDSKYDSENLTDTAFAPAANGIKLREDEKQSDDGRGVDLENKDQIDNDDNDDDDHDDDDDSDSDSDGGGDDDAALDLIEDDE